VSDRPDAAGAPGAGHAIALATPGACDLCGLLSGQVLLPPAPLPGEDGERLALAWAYGFACSIAVRDHGAAVRLCPDHLERTHRAFARMGVRVRFQWPGKGKAAS
jgi:hypothetical protein